MKLMLTEKQIRVLRFFRDYRRDKGIAPTLDEAAQALGVSKITIHEHLNQLTLKGAIHRDRAKARAVAILHDPDASDDPVAPAAIPTVPLIGMIAAGRPIEALEDRQELSLTELVPTGDQIYLLRVRGKSMIEDHIDDGDLVVVERRETANDGDIVVQTRQVLANLQAIIEAAGGSLQQVVKTTVFLKNLDDFTAMNQIYAEAFVAHTPARSTVQVAKLPRDVLVEIEAIVALN